MCLKSVWFRAAQRTIEPWCETHHTGDSQLNTSCLGGVLVIFAFLLMKKQQQQHATVRESGCSE